MFPPNQTIVRQVPTNPYPGLYRLKLKRQEQEIAVDKEYTEGILSLVGLEI